MDRTPLPSKLLSVLLAAVLSLTGLDPSACGELSSLAAGAAAAAPPAPAPASPYGDPAEVRLDRGDVVLGAEGVSGFDGEGAPVRAATRAVVVGQADDGAPCSHTVSVGAGSWRVVLGGVRFEGASTFMDLDAGASVEAGTYGSGAAVGGGGGHANGPIVVNGGTVRASVLGGACTVTSAIGAGGIGHGGSGFGKGSSVEISGGEVLATAGMGADGVSAESVSVSGTARASVLSWSYGAGISADVLRVSGGSTEVAAGGTRAVGMGARRIALSGGCVLSIVRRHNLHQDFDTFRIASPSSSIPMISPA